MARALCIAGWASAVVAAVAIAAVVWLRRSLPEVSGQRSVRGIGAELEIVRDAHAIPHIYARSVEDAYFGLGYVHAQDRLWQLELNRRVATGTLAELVGERALDTDKLFRTLDLAGVAERTYGALDAESRAVLAAYARGVNEFLAEDPALPPELAVLRTTPRAWRGSDCVLFIKLLAFQLSGNFSDELWRVRLGQRLAAAQLAEFAPPYPGSEAIPFAQLWQVYDGVQLGERPHSRQLLRSLAPLAAALAPLAPADFGHAVGSNNWAVDGTRSATGKPLLANDPHLALSAPSQWYLAHLEAPGWLAVGATLPAAAGVILGHNGKVAWSFTNLHPDTQDVFVERLAPGDPQQYLTPDGPRAFERRRERIRVRGGADVEHWVRSTRHGPVISDVSEDARGVLSGDQVLALGWTGLRADDTTAAFPLRASRAANAAEFREAARSFHAPAQNIVYADTAGAIGFIAAGQIPVRAPDNALRGLVPSPGWLAEYDWRGTIAFDALPQEFAPSAGRLVTANQDVRPPGYAPWLGADWGPPYRRDRIAALLDARATHSLESFASIARDRKSRIAELVLPELLAALGAPEPDERAVIDALSRWDREMRPNAFEPLVFAAWLRELSRFLYADELGPLFEEEWPARPEFLRSVLRGVAGQARWCDDRGTPAVETCGAIARTSLRAALRYLDGRFGEDRSAWTWAEAHPSVSAHRIFGPLPVVGSWFDVAAVRGGDSSTVDVGSYWVEDDEDAFHNHWGPGFRAIYDLADLSRSVAIVNTGQSGHFLSPHYRDMNPAWARGEYLPLLTARARVTESALGQLLLAPSPPPE